MDFDKPGKREDEPTIGTSRLETREAEVRHEGTRKLPDLSEGHLMGNYRLIRKLGAGGFGEVWEAESVETGRRLAIKILTEVPVLSSNMIDRFQQEGRLAASINHPNCVYVFGAEEMDGFPAITMELMPGGTLQDILNRDEQLPVMQAVDYTIQLMDGLEAAHEAGVIHRDIKPSNCFLDEGGNIKIGDFGLSKTLESDTKLTVTGTFLGTPSYASPEQVRGQDLDFRTDLYSLAATLYAMISGNPPFEGKHAAEVLARIAADPPPPLRTKRNDVPPGLEKAILRALAKDPAKRFSSYNAFRKALTPYSSVGLRISGLGKRCIAYWIDSIILIPFVILGGLWNWTSYQEFSLVEPAMSFVYFFLFDKLWGRTPGKSLFGLRVVSNTGTPLSWKAASLRTAIFVILTSVLAFSKVIIPLGPSSELSLNIGWLGIVATMRRRNSFAGLHEIVSQTRVMTFPPAERVRVPDLRPAPLAQVSDTFGPYRASALLWENHSEKLYAGYDEVLNREVWIRTYGTDDRALPARELSGARSGRLRWIQGSRDPGNHWDVYEFPSGSSLCRWIESHGRLSWPEVRAVMEGMATELDARMVEGSLSTEIGLDHLWVDRFGHSKLLDFPLSNTPESGSTTHQRWDDFLHQLLLYGLTGKIVPLESLNEKIPEVPVPESSRNFITALCRKKFDSAKHVALELQQLVGHRAEISRTRRFASLLLPFFPFLILLMILLQFLFFMPKWFPDMALATDHLKTLSRLSESKSPQDQIQAEAVEILLAYGYSEYLKSSTGKTAYRLTFENSEIEQLESILRKHPHVSLEQYQEARAVTELQTDFVTIVKEQIPDDRPWHTYVFPVVSGISYLSFLAIPLVFILRRPLLFALLGISLQTGKGRGIGRLHAAYRSLISWFPILLFSPGVVPYFPVSPPLGTYFYSGLIALTLAGMVYAVVYPNRGIPDRIAGTVLVPD